MFTANDKARLLVAIELQVASLKRQAKSKPMFQTVVDFELVEYDRLVLKVRQLEEVPNEDAKGVIKK